MKAISNQAGVPHGKLVGAAWAISTAVALVTLGGFGMIFGLVMALITRGIDISPGGMVLIFSSLLIILAIAWLLVRQLSRALDLPKLSGETREHQFPKLSENPAQQISAPREPLSSVTENTTRTFQPIYKERDTQR
ncbi:MAG: hypothetical protein ACMG6H_02855 [Acidobacteriota bacterium]